MSSNAITPTQLVPLVHATRVVGLLAAGLLAGAVAVIWLLDVELGRSGELYMQYRQATTGALTRLLPPLGGVALLATGVAVLLDGRRWTLLVALVCLVAGLVTTVTVHFPLNDAIVAWSRPPADWTQIRDRWRAAHVARTVASVVAFVLLTVDLGRYPTGPGG